MKVLGEIESDGLDRALRHQVEIGKGVAMSHLPETWPPSWPDYPTWTYSGDPIIRDGEDITPQVDWNGYFGRAQLNADQESYFWMDDNNDEEWYVKHDFLPDSLDPTRRGEAIQVSVRGLQWANFLAEDVMFWLYNIKNDGTEQYDRVTFGSLVGSYVGVEAPEYNDDASFFDVRESIVYTLNEILRKADSLYFPGCKSTMVAQSFGCWLYPLCFS